MNDLICEFREWVDGVYGTYMDALSGFPLVRAEYEKMKAGTWPAPVNPSQARPSAGSDPQIFAYARLVKGGKADRPTHIHQVDMETVIERNTFLGKNTGFVGRMAIVAIYGYWNDHTRVRVEEHLGWAKDSLSVPIMGDRYVRAIWRLSVGCRKASFLEWRSVRAAAPSLVRRLSWWPVSRSWQ